MQPALEVLLPLAARLPDLAERHGLQMHSMHHQLAMHCIVLAALHCLIHLSHGDCRLAGPVSKTALCWVRQQHCPPALLSAGDRPRQNSQAGTLTRSCLNEWDCALH
jgi:hypothetical protein